MAYDPAALHDADRQPRRRPAVRPVRGDRPGRRRLRRRVGGGHAATRRDARSAGAVGRCGGRRMRPANTRTSCRRSRTTRRRGCGSSTWCAIGEPDRTSTSGARSTVDHEHLGRGAWPPGPVLPPDPVPTRTSRLPRTAPTLVPDSFDQLRAQAAESVRRDARRLREVAERYREQYRGRLEEWMQLRARVDHRRPPRRGGGPSPEVLRAKHDALAKELAGLQAQPEADRRRGPPARAGVALPGQRPTSQVDEPPLSDADVSPAAISLRIIQAQEGERQRLAEEVHDGPAQVLTNAIFQVEYLDRVHRADCPARPPAPSWPSCAPCCATGWTRSAHSSPTLRPPVVDVGLGQAIADGRRRVRSQARHRRRGRRCTGIDERLTARPEASVLRIVQEALQNVRKHAAATAVRIGLEGDHARHRRQRPRVRRDAAGLGAPATSASSSCASAPS